MNLRSRVIKKLKKGLVAQCDECVYSFTDDSVNYWECENSEIDETTLELVLDDKVKCKFKKEGEPTYHPYIRRGFDRF